MNLTKRKRSPEKNETRRRRLYIRGLALLVIAGTLVVWLFARPVFYPDTFYHYADNIWIKSDENDVASDGIAWKLSAGCACLARRDAGADRWSPYAPLPFEHPASLAFNDTLVVVTAKEWQAAVLTPDGEWQSLPVPPSETDEPLAFTDSQGNIWLDSGGSWLLNPDMTWSSTGNQDTTTRQMMRLMGLSEYSGYSTFWLSTQQGTVAIELSALKNRHYPYPDQGLRQEQFMSTFAGDIRLALIAEDNSLLVWSTQAWHTWANGNARTPVLAVLVDAAGQISVQTGLPGK